MITAHDYDAAFEASGHKGHCYQHAAQHLLYDDAPEGSLLVHGSVAFMPSHLPQVPLDHAWVLYPDGRVFEPISGLVMTPDEWEAIVKADYWKAEMAKQDWPMAEWTYTKEEARAHVLDEMTWGPWLPLWDLEGATK